MESCPMHGVLEERIKRQDEDYSELSAAIVNLQSEFISELGKLSDKVEAIHNILAGGLNDQIGVMQKVSIMESNVSFLDKNQTTLKECIEKITPWFSVFKWSVCTIAPVFMLGTISLAVGLLTGKIKILM